MKKKIIKGICIFIGFVIILNIAIVGVNMINSPKEEEGEQKIEKKVIHSVICTFTDQDDIHYSIELSFEENQLVTKVEETSWTGKDQKTCDFYKKRTETYNAITGITDSVECGDSDGTRRTVYQIRELDTVEANVAELKYIREDQGFDFAGYESFRQKRGYRCVES